jgi:hypothetical protein
MTRNSVGPKPLLPLGKPRIGGYLGTRGDRYYDWGTTALSIKNAPIDLLDTRWPVCKPAPPDNTFDMSVFSVAVTGRYVAYACIGTVMRASDGALRKCTVSPASNLENQPSRFCHLRVGVGLQHAAVPSSQQPWGGCPESIKSCTVFEGPRRNTGRHRRRRTYTLRICSGHRNHNKSHNGDRDKPQIRDFTM